MSQLETRCRNARARGSNGMTWQDLLRNSTLCSCLLTVSALGLVACGSEGNERSTIVAGQPSAGAGAEAHDVVPTVPTTLSEIVPTTVSTTQSITSITMATPTSNSTAVTTQSSSDTAEPDLIADAATNLPAFVSSFIDVKAQAGSLVLSKSDIATVIVTRDDNARPDNYLQRFVVAGFASGKWETLATVDESSYFIVDPSGSFEVMDVTGDGRSDILVPEIAGSSFTGEVLSDHRGSWELLLFNWGSVVDTNAGADPHFVDGQVTTVNRCDPARPSTFTWAYKDGMFEPSMVPGCS
jgi:hypothetical protein